jgi:hypothetical protein
MGQLEGGIFLNVASSLGISMGGGAPFGEFSTSLRLTIAPSSTNCSQLWPEKPALHWHLPWKQYPWLEQSFVQRLC